MVAGTLKGVISQRLVPTVDGQGRVAVCEVLRMTGRVRDMIMDPEHTGKLPEVIAEGEYYGMQTFDQALMGHVQAGRVSMQDALRAATSPHDFKLLLAAEGRRATSMDDVADTSRPHEPRVPMISAATPAAPTPAPAAPSAPPPPPASVAPPPSNGHLSG
jgi:twitching motility protein PilT